MKTFAHIVAIATVALPLYSQVSPAINPIPSREFGHAKLIFSGLTTTPNLIEGKELNSPAAIAFDTSSSPPILYVADSSNNRVLAWQNPSALTLANQADKVIGQRDFYSAYDGGPGRASPALTSAGMALPSGLAVDANGNLYVFDAGNNRILRFPKPMQQQGEFVSPDLVIGQKTFTSGNAANQGASTPTNKTLASNLGGVLHASLAFDAQGNLWVSDSGNHRVLRFPKANLTGSEPAADLVLGQQTFTSRDAATGGPTSPVGFVTPTGIAVTPSGAVYVTDQLQRALYFAAPATGVQASRILGIDKAGTQQDPRPPAPNDYTLGRGTSGGAIPQCVFLLGEIPFFCDNAAHRLVRYNIAAQWPAEVQTAVSPPIIDVYGQATLFDGGSNRGRGNALPESNTFFQPISAAIYNNELWVADTGNNRILVLGESAPLQYTLGTRVVGQARFDVGAANLVEGRDLFVNLPGQLRGAGIAVDRNSTPNHLYVADSLNNRILGFRDSRVVGTDVRTLLTQEADIIIGQQDKFHAVVNYPSADTLVPSDQGLFNPSGVAVDAQGNLWVADTGNGRALRFPAPFDQPQGQIPRANVVLGQGGFTFKITDPSSFTMSNPVGLAVFNNGDVAVSDTAHNRIMLFRKQGADFVNGQVARAVLGQQNFNTITAGNGTAALNRPRGMAVDSSDRLYVADSSNNRVIVYSSTGNTPSGASGTAIPNISGPEDVAVSPNSGEIWVAAYNSNAVFRFREFSQLQGNLNPTASLQSALPIGLELDAFDNIIAVEGVNRMTFFFAQMAYRTAATSASGNNIIATMTPNQYVYAARLNKSLALTPESAIPPYPKTMSGIQVLVDGIPSAITKVTEDLVFFLIPNNAPSSGTAEFLVTRPESGEILAAGTFAMGPAAPGFFALNQQGTGQIAALLEDYTVNGPSNKVALGGILQLFLTGYGHLDNHPPDGEGATDIIRTDVEPVVNVGGITLPPQNVLYSGLTVLPGLWQVNIRLPKTGDPGGAPLPGDRVIIFLTFRDKPSNVGGTGTLGTDQQLTIPNGLITTIAVK